MIVNKWIGFPRRVCDDKVWLLTDQLRALLSVDCYAPSSEKEAKAANGLYFKLDEYGRCSFMLDGKKWDKLKDFSDEDVRAIREYWLNRQDKYTLVYNAANNPYCNDIVGTGQGWIPTSVPDIRPDKDGPLGVALKGSCVPFLVFFMERKSMKVKVPKIYKSV